MSSVQLQMFAPITDEHNTPSWFRTALQTLGVDQSTGWPDRFGAALRTYFVAHSQRSIRTLSLFSGGGGLDTAFRDAGFDVVEMVEIESRYAETLRANFAHESTVTCIDIRKYVAPDIGPIDFIIGGPPCQTFSAAGRRAAGVMGTDDPRGTLFQEYIRLLELLQPQGFLFENVYGITGAQGGAAWDAILAAFKAAGYNTNARILDAADYGVPQHRERLFIVGVKTGTFLFPYPTHGPDSPDRAPYFSAGEAVANADISDATVGLGGRYGHLLDAIPPGLNYSFYTPEMGHPAPVFSWRSKFSDFLYKADPDRPVRTIKAQGGQYTGPFSWQNRPFSLAELKRLQTFPDQYQIIGGRQGAIEQIGNSVPPQIGRMLALSVLDQIMAAPIPFKMQYMAPQHELGFRQRKRALTEQYAQKAAIAHAQHPTITPPGGSHKVSDLKHLQRYLGSDFSWTTHDSPTAYPCTIDWHEQADLWELHIRAADIKMSSSSMVALHITALPQMPWSLPIERVSIWLPDDHPRFVLMAWKAFEEYVLILTGIADLVQLAGYYQYRSRIQASLDFGTLHPAETIWRVLQHVTQGVGVGQALPAEQFADCWNIPGSEVVPLLHTLRSLGYEIRSRSTNPQMAGDDYLVPYLFPTFTPRSVQLRKQL